MSAWCFDLGNTRLKFSGPAQHVALAHDALAQLPEAVHGEVALLASVGPCEVEARLRVQLAQRFRRVHVARTLPVFAGLRIAYPQAAQLGVDRFLAMLAFTAETAPLVLVSVGTALTLDWLDPAGRHRGGMIAPSPALMREALHQRAPVLPAHGGEATRWATNTADALARGCLGAAAALVDSACMDVEKHSGSMPRLVLHGGGAAVLAPHLQQRHELTDGLVLRGLRRWGVALGIA